MRKRSLFVGSLFGLAVVGSFAGRASATLLASDDFISSNGLLSGDSGGTGFNGSWSTPSGATTSTPGLTGSPSLTDLTGPQPTDGSVEMNVAGSRDLTNTIGGSGIVYISFKTNAVALNGTDSFIYTSNNVLMGHGDDGTLGIVNGGGIDQNENQVYNALYEFNYNNNTVYFYANPTSATAPDHATADYSQDYGTLGTFNSLSIRQQELSSDYSPAPGETQYSALRIGTEYSDVSFVAAPEPASLSVLGLAGAGLLARRRRHA